MHLHGLHRADLEVLGDLLAYLDGDRLDDARHGREDLRRHVHLLLHGHVLELLVSALGVQLELVLRKKS